MSNPVIDRRSFAFPIPEAERLAWCEWLRHHTINPDEVVAAEKDGGFIELDKDARQIRYLAYDQNENGQRFVGPDGNHASRSVRVVQLEARPSDFPM